MLAHLHCFAGSAGQASAVLQPFTRRTDEPSHLADAVKLRALADAVPGAGTATAKTSPLHGAGQKAASKRKRQVDSGAAKRDEASACIEDFHAASIAGAGASPGAHGAVQITGATTLSLRKSLALLQVRVCFEVVQSSTTTCNAKLLRSILVIVYMQHRLLCTANLPTTVIVRHYVRLCVRRGFVSNKHTTHAMVQALRHNVMPALSSPTCHPPTRPGAVDAGRSCMLCGSTRGGCDTSPRQEARRQRHLR